MFLAKLQVLEVGPELGQSAWAMAGASSAACSHEPVGTSGVTVTVPQSTNPLGPLPTALSLSLLWQ